MVRSNLFLFPIISYIPFLDLYTVWALDFFLIKQLPYYPYESYLL